MPTVTDRKLQQTSDNTAVAYYVADVVSAQDYYPFGSLMPGRKFSSGNYRYGFNGKENDNEVKGIEGSQQDYGMRIYDPRVGRFLSVDPLTNKYPWYTPYQFAGNKPIRFIDLDGMEEGDPVGAFLNWTVDTWEDFKSWDKWCQAAGNVNKTVNLGYIAADHISKVAREKDLEGNPIDYRGRTGAVSDLGVDLVMWGTGEKAFTLFRTETILERQMLKQSSAMGDAEAKIAQQEAIKSSNSAQFEIKVSGQITEGMQQQQVQQWQGKAGGIRLPKSDGAWSGQPGNSTWNSTLDQVNKVTLGEGVPYVNNRPMLDKWAKGTFTVEGMNGTMKVDLPLIYKKMMSEFNFGSQQEVIKWLKANELSPHHANGNTIQLVPTPLNKIPHSGGASDLRNQ
ncbi:MAG: RHS repeat-associated core domain-containing protein [Bacteroidota bacterium]